MPGMTKEDRQRLLAQVREVYADLEKRSIERNCTGLSECCRFRLTGRTPFLTRGEALLAMQAARASGRKTLPASGGGRRGEDGGSGRNKARSGGAGTAAGSGSGKATTDGACPMLGADGRCTIYLSRPFACRTHFCDAAGGPWPRKEVRDLIHRLEDIDHRLGGQGGMGLPAAMKWAAGEG
jgi:Fe-S-cluster containining protein